MTKTWRAAARAAVVSAVVVALLTLGMGRALAADVVPVKEILDMAPANPSMMVVVPSMGRMSRHLSAANSALALGLVQLDDPLTRFKQALGISKGLNDEGAMLVVAVPEAAADGADAKGGRFMALLPVSDYPAFVQSFGADGKQAIAELKMGDGVTGWARKLEGYVVLGSSRAVVEGYRPAGAGAALLAAAGPQAVWQIGSSDCSMYVEAASASMLQPYAQAIIDWSRKAVAASVANSRPGSIGATWAKMVEGMSNGMTQAAIRDCQAIVVSADADESAVSLSVSTQFKPGTPSAALFATQGESAPLLLRVPLDQFLVAGAAHVPSSGLVAMSEQSAAVAVPTSSPVMTALTAKTVPLLKKARFIADLASPPQSGGSTDSLYHGATIIETSDTAGTIQAIKDLIVTLGTIETADAKIGDPGLALNANYIPKGLRIDEIDVDTYEVHYNFPQNMMADMGKSIGPLALLVGAGGRSGYVAAINDTFVVITTTADTPFFKKVVTALKQENGLGTSDLIAGVRAAQVPKPSAELFIGFHSVNAAFNKFLKMTGRKDIPALEEAPPIALSWHGFNGGITGRLLVPMPVAKHLYNHGHEMLSPFLPWTMVPGGKPPAATPGTPGSPAASGSPALPRPTPAPAAAAAAPDRPSTSGEPGFVEKPD